MIRSICIVSREYPPDTSWGGIARVAQMTAQGFVAHGLAVHVIALDPSSTGRRELCDGVTVHRIAAATSGQAATPDIDQSLWSVAAANYYAQLDELVDFDVVLCPDYFAEALRIPLGPHTALVTQLHLSQALIHPEHLDSKRFPAQAVSAQMELLALRRADVLVSASELVATRTAADLGNEAPPVEVLPLPFAANHCVRDGQAPSLDGRLELVFVGRLEERKGVDLALRTVAELVARGVDVRLQLIGRDTPYDAPNSSYRRSVLLPLMDVLGLSFDTVRFVDELDFPGVLRHLSAAHAALLPSHLESFHAAAAEALSIEVPVVCGTAVGLTEWITADEGLAAIATDDAEKFARQAADRLCDRRWLTSSAALGQRRVRELFDPVAATSAYLELFESIERLPRFSPQLRAPSHLHPKLGVVVLAHNALEYTKRCIRSLLWHTDVPMQLVVVDNASSDGTLEWLSSIDDERVMVVHLATNRGVPGGRNAGLDHLRGDEDYVVFLDNDTEVVKDWWVPYVRALESDVETGIAGEDGVVVQWSDSGRILTGIAGNDVARCDVVVGFCMFLRPEVVGDIGHFDERLGLFWHDDDDLAMRAQRIGYQLLRVRSGRVLHFEHRSSVTVEGIWKAPGQPAAMSEDNQRTLAKKHARQQLSATSPFLLLADATEAVAHPELLDVYQRCFRAEDEVALVLLGVGTDPLSYEVELRAAAARCGFDLEVGPKVVAMCPPTASEDGLAMIADEVYAVLSTRPPAGTFSHLAWCRPDDSDYLRCLAARAWRARPDRAAAAAAAVDLEVAS